MKKKEQEPKEEQASSVRSYFTPEINAMVNEMTMKEMEEAMKAMVSTRAWIAIIKYVELRSTLLGAQLRSTNPTTDPHTISWSQGAMAGIYDIENYVIELNSTALAKEEDEGNTNYDPEGKV